MKTVIYFSAPWCEPCKAMKPAFIALMEDEGIKYELVDVSENQAAARKYKVMGVPTIVVTDGEDIIARATGSRSRGQILELIGRE